VRVVLEKVFLALCIGLLLSNIATNPMGLDKPQRWLLGASLFFLACFLAYTVSRYNETDSRKYTPSPPQQQPNVFVRLVIDSVTSKTVVYHLQVENGPFLIKNIRVASDSGKLSTFEFKLLPRRLPPNKQFRIAGPPAESWAKKHTNFTVRLFFTAEVNGPDKNFVVTSSFIVRPEDIKQQTIEPEFRAEEEGEFNAQEEQKAVDAVINQFSLAEGTIAFPIDEIKDGHPNVVRFENEQKEFVFDPVSKTATFKIKTQSGRLVNLSQPFEESKTGQHVILLAWNSTGALLCVDDAEMKDMPSEKQQNKP
jgi:hypothetical protein